MTKTKVEVDWKKEAEKLQKERDEQDFKIGAIESQNETYKAALEQGMDGNQGSGNNELVKICTRQLDSFDKMIELIQPLITTIIERTKPQ